MLNIFRSDPEVCDRTVPGRNISDARKKLRWLINNPPADLAKLLVIDADMAGAMLERNKDEEWKNRPHSEKGLLRYARAMKGGTWKLTGEPIIFSKSGNLLNGQHRLMACINAGISFPSVVIFGIDDDAFKFMDIGIARTAGHIFAIEEIPNYNAMSAAARLLFAYDNVKNWSGGNIEIENDELLSFYYEHEALQKSFAFGKLMHRELRIGGRWAIFSHYICARKNRQLADEYFEKLSSGASLGAKTVTFSVRKRLLTSALSTSEKLSDVHCAAFIIKGWNAIREERSLGVLKWRTEQTPNEPFPVAL